MRLSEGVEWGLHAVVLLAFAPAGVSVPSTRIAEFHGVPAPYLARHFQALARSRDPRVRARAAGRVPPGSPG